MRKPTDPPPFDPNSRQAAAARQSAPNEPARPKAKPVRDGAEAVMEPRASEPPSAPRATTEFEPGSGSARAPAPSRTKQPEQAGTEPADDLPPAIDSRPAAERRPAAEPPAGADRPAATSLSWPSGDGTNPGVGAPDAAGAAPAERWNDPWAEQPAASAPPPQPATPQVDPWSDPPQAPRPRQEAPVGDGPMPPSVESPPDTDPPGPSR